MNRTRYIPSIVMLSAAFVVCVSTMYFKYDTKQIVFLVLVTSVVFFIIGQIIRLLAEKFLVISTMEEVLTEDGENKESEEDKQDKSNTENNVSEGKEEKS